MTWLTQALPAGVVVLVLLWLPGLGALRAVGLRGLLLWSGAPAVSLAAYAVAVQVVARLGMDWRPLSAVPTTLLVVAVLALAGRALLGDRGVRRVLAAQVRLAGSSGRGPARAAPGAKQRGTATVRPWSGGSGGAGATAGTAAATTTPAAAGPAATVSEVADAGRVRWFRRPPSVVAALTLVLVCGAVLVIVPAMIGMHSAQNPLQQWDGVFHLNGIRLIQDTGDATNLDGLYGTGAHVFYPATWHAFMALVPGAHGLLPWVSIPAATSAYTLVCAGIVWPVVVAGWCWAVLPGRRLLLVLAVALLGAFPMFPTVLWTIQAVWPNGTSILVLPGVAALWVFVLRVRLEGTGTPAPSAPRAGRAGVPWRALTVVVGVALFATVGLAAAHPTGVAALLVLVGPLAATRVWVAASRRWRAGRRGVVLGWTAVAVVLVALVLARATQTASFASVTGYERPFMRPYSVSVLRLLVDFVITAWPGNLVVSTAVVVGIVVAWRRRLRWLVVAWGLTVVLSALAAGWENPLRAVTGIWYKQAMRIEAFYPVTSVLLAALGVVAIAGWVLRRVRGTAPAGGGATTVGQAVGGRSVAGPSLAGPSLAGPSADLAPDDVTSVDGPHLGRTDLPRSDRPAAVLRALGARRMVERAGGSATVGALVWVLLASFVVSVGYQAPSRAHYFAWSYQPARLKWGTMATADELDLLRSLPGTIGPDAVVIGSPYSGLPLGYGLAGVRSVYLQLGAGSADPARAYLRAHFRDVHTDPQVCTYLAELGVTHFYDDRATPEADHAWDGKDAPGFTDVDVSSGFVPVTSTGKVTVYKITACEQAG